MINSIKANQQVFRSNEAQQASVQSQSNLDVTQQTASQSEQQTTLNGTEAIASYNQAMINQQTQSSEPAKIDDPKQQEQPISEQKL